MAMLPGQVEQIYSSAHHS